MGEKAKETIEKSGKLGPVLGGVIGAFPQCGFSAAASNLYAGRVITLGTLLAVFLSTSDEMLPILVSEQVNASVILKLLGLKVLVGMVVGLLVDLSVGEKQRHGHTHGEMDIGHMDIGHVCEHEHCRCEDGIVKSALRHTLNIFLFLILITLLLNILIYFAGEGFLTGLILNKPLVSAYDCRAGRADSQLCFLGNSHPTLSGRRYGAWCYDGRAVCRNRCGAGGIIPHE